MNFLDRQVTDQTHRNATGAQPFLKWAGGKRWLFKKYRHLFPSEVGRLIDPFIGGGSSFFSLRPTSALLADLNQDLIDLYNAVRDDPRAVARMLIHYHHSHCNQFYYKTR